MYGVDLDSDEYDDDYEDQGSDDDSFDGGGGGGGDEWEEIPPHLLQQSTPPPPQQQQPTQTREEYLETHPEREVGLSELISMGFDPSAAWDALESTNDDIKLALDILTAG